MAISNYETANVTAEELLNHAVESLEQESSRIQIQGRALTPEEQTRLERIGKGVESINQAIEVLAGGGK